MHDTAFQIGCLAIDTYCDPLKSKILEIGSYDVNGSLRSHIGPGVSYLGLDFEAGPGVDIVVTPGQAFPVEDNHFDLVIASSALEHDPAFWSTFLEMCRKAKKGAYLYINVPSNGVVHRYPKDCWRFYPDSGRALAAWARSQGEDVTLVESFIANRQNDIWNDFVAVFHKNGGDEKEPTQFLYQKFSSANVLIGDDGEVINSLAETEDMILNARVCAQVEESMEALSTAQEQVQELSRELDVVRDKMVESRKHYEVLIAEKHGEIGEISKKAQRLENELAEANSLVSRISQERRAIELEATLVKEALVRAENARNSAVAAQRSIEEILQASEAENAELRVQLYNRTEKFEWLQKVNEVLMDVRGWWRFMPPSFRRKRELRILACHGLFDSDRYYKLYPDVVAAGIDPLRHYIVHGLSEGRER